MKNKMRGQRFNNPEELKLTNIMFLLCDFQSGTNVLKIGLFKCKNVSLLEESVLRSDKTYILGEKVFLVIFSYN